MANDGNFFDRENMLARVIAFLIACALWMYVMNEQNPLVERNYVVNLELRNVPEGMIVLNTPDKVRVKKLRPMLILLTKI